MNLFKESLKQHKKVIAERTTNQKKNIIPQNYSTNLDNNPYGFSAKELEEMRIAEEANKIRKERIAPKAPSSFSTYEDITRKIKIDALEAEQRRIEAKTAEEMKKKEEDDMNLEEGAYDEPSEEDEDKDEGSDKTDEEEEEEVETKNNNVYSSKYLVGGAN